MQMFDISHGRCAGSRHGIAARRTYRTSRMFRHDLVTVYTQTLFRRQANYFSNIEPTYYPIVVFRNSKLCPRKGFRMERRSSNQVLACACHCTKAALLRLFPQNRQNHEIKYQMLPLFLVCERTSHSRSLHLCNTMSPD